jgi:hypothetical protein
LGPELAAKLVPSIPMEFTASQTPTLTWGMSRFSGTWSSQTTKPGWSSIVLLGIGFFTWQKRSKSWLVEGLRQKGRKMQMGS